MKRAAQWWKSLSGPTRIAIGVCLVPLAVVLAPLFLVGLVVALVAAGLTDTLDKIADHFD